MSETFNPDFYRRHFDNVIFPFWERKGVDNDFGGYFTCFSNDGKTLISKDKYTWSQGRMVWVLSELVRMNYRPENNDKYIRMAKSGVDFLTEHCLLPDGSCSFLSERDGRHKESGQSVYADCFVVLGLSNFASVTKDGSSLDFAEKLFGNICSRYECGRYETAPYPVPEGLRAHGVPMILTNTARALADALTSFGYDAVREYRLAYSTACDVCDNFIDKNGVLHEFITGNGVSYDELLLRYINPGHTIEDTWFMLDEFERVGDTERAFKVIKAMKNALRLGWDEEYGGLMLFSDCDGGIPCGMNVKYADDKMTRKVTEDCASKLWWVHSEALYTTIRVYLKTADKEIFDYAEKLFDYTMKIFPNTENDEGEWIQIRSRDGRPENRIVALPVKDPFHISRNLLKIISLLENTDKRKTVLYI